MEENKYNKLNDVFKSEEIWDNYDSGNTIIKKAEELKSLIPDDVDSILDVGCGNGVITNYFNKYYKKVVGVDVSEAALKQVEGESQQCSSAELSFKDNSFDMIFSSEMLEHLPDDILKKTIDHIKRISKKYILITIPYKEKLRSRFVKCPVCGKEFHAYHHLQSFDEKRLTSLFEDSYNNIYYMPMGFNTRADISILIKIRQKVFGQYYHTDTKIICYCGNTNFPEPVSSLFTKAINFFNHVFAKKHAFWLAAFYVKKEVGK